MKIKGIILDVDGVIIGEKIGYNFPSPHPEVISALRKIKKKGIFVSLCTGKPGFGIKEIVERAGLDNPHIADGGGVIIDPINNKVLKANIIESSLAAKVIGAYLKRNAYVELFTADDYFIQESQISEVTEKHTKILKAPHIVKSLIDRAAKSKITKIMPIARDENERKQLTELFTPFEGKLSLNWGIHPAAKPLQFGIITAKGISKKSAAKEIVDNAKITFDEVLGVGDTINDWPFIQLCNYGAAMGNASDELKKLVLTKGKEHSYIGATVDNNGIIDIFRHFNLI